MTRYVLAALLAAAAVPSFGDYAISTSFDMSEWAQGQPIPSGGITGGTLTKNGDWTTSSGSRDQITAAANRPGSPGRGFRHWVGNGTNNAGGGIRLAWVGLPEFWLRYYVRFQRGFSWSGATEMKTIYVNYGEAGTFYWGLKDGYFGGHVEVDRRAREGALLGNLVSSVSWSEWQGGSRGDGRFHLVELHCKMNTGGLQNGVMEAWLDGVLVGSWHDVRFSPDGGRFSTMKVGENHNDPQNAADVYVDFDDIAISATGRVGP